MTEPGPFAPPSGALPPRPPAAPPADAPASVLPPPTGQPVGTMPPAFAPPVVPPPPRRRWLIPVIAGGSLAVVALAIGVGFAAVQVGGAISRSPLAGSPEQEFVEMDSLLRGDPGSPVAADPLTCGACFNVAHAEMISFPSATYAQLGVPITDGFTYDTTVGADEIQYSSWWTADEAGPDTCYFGYPPAPLYTLPNASAGGSVNDDQIYYPDAHRDQDELHILSESFRVFDETALATTYLAGVEAAVAGCSVISFPEQGWSGAITATPALDLPPSVAAYGWVQGNDYSRYFAVDLQRGNLVVRLAMWTDADGATESEFRAFVEEYAAKLAELEPAG